jgi:hypothetical protein
MEGLAFGVLATFCEIAFSFGARFAARKQRRRGNAARHIDVPPERQRDQGIAANRRRVNLFVRAGGARSWSFRAIEQPRRRSVMLHEKSPFPLAAWTLSEERSRLLLEDFYRGQLSGAMIGIPANRGSEPPFRVRLSTAPGGGIYIVIANDLDEIADRRELTIHMAHERWITAAR